MGKSQRTSNRFVVGYRIAVGMKCNPLVPQGGGFGGGSPRASEARTGFFP
jgi:hypothetical protein